MDLVASATFVPKIRSNLVRIHHSSSILRRTEPPFLVHRWWSPSSSPVNLLLCNSRRKSRDVQPVLKQTIAEEADEDEEVADDIVDEFDGEDIEDDEDIEDFGDEADEDALVADDIVDEFDDEDIEDFGDDDEDFEDDDLEAEFGDGAAGGGISLAGTWWDKKALSLAEEVSSNSFNGELKLYAFKTSNNGNISLRIEKLSTKSGSPSMNDIEAFTSAYRVLLDEAELAGTIPANVSLEVSSPGVERVVRIPEDLERFKDRTMYVRYLTEGAAAATPQENDGVFRLISYDLDQGNCTWGVADVRINREQAGKGRPLSKKQRDWRLQTPFESLRLVRLYSEC